MATAVIFANSVARTANYYAGGTGASSGTKEKHLAEAIEAVKDYIGVEGPRPLIKDEDKQDAIFRQLCISQVTASSDRESTARSNCNEVTMVETIVCIIPKLPLAEEDDLPHPMPERVPGHGDRHAGFSNIRYTAIRVIEMDVSRIVFKSILFLE